MSYGIVMPCFAAIRTTLLKPSIFLLGHGDDIRQMGTRLTYTGSSFDMTAVFRCLEMVLSLCCDVLCEEDVVADWRVSMK